MPCALKISEAASLAIHALGYLARSGDQPVTTREIATRFEVSEAHLSKVLQRLVKIDLLRSARGPRGGFVLSRDPASVSLLEVFEGIEGPFELSQCLLSAAICDGETCVLGQIVVEANTLLRTRLKTTTLEDIGSVIATATSTTARATTGRGRSATQ
jgi:Rrf2 family protein